MRFHVVQALNSCSKADELHEISYMEVIGLGLMVQVVHAQLKNPDLDPRP